jgi:hypothetical protein
LRLSFAENKRPVHPVHVCLKVIICFVFVNYAAPSRTIETFEKHLPGGHGADEYNDDIAEPLALKLMKVHFILFQ